MLYEKYELLANSQDQEGASDGLLLNVKWAIFQLYHCKHKLHFNEMMMTFAMY
jgi:hypothetical protein